jgi:hypothetical protein
MSVCNVYEIRQKKGSVDCGPACASFLRYGGDRSIPPPLRSGASCRSHGGSGDSAVSPKEGGKSITQAFLEEQHQKMRTELGLSQIRLSHYELRDVLNEYANLYAGGFFRFQISEKDVAWNLGDGTEAVRKRLEKFHSKDSRGVVVLVEISNHLDLNPCTGSCEKHGLHFVVVTGFSPDKKTLYYFDPILTRSTTEPIPTNPDGFAVAHLRAMRQSDRRYANRVRSYIVHGKSCDKDAVKIKNGDLLGELDVNNNIHTRSQDLYARADAAYFNNYIDADKAAEKYTAKGSGAVVEYPEGTFG